MNRLGFFLMVFIFVGASKAVEAIAVSCVGDACANNEDTVMPVDKLRCIIEGEMSTLDYDDNGNPPKPHKEWGDICKDLAKVAVCRRNVGDHGGINCKCPEDCNALAGENKRRWEEGGKKCAEDAINDFNNAPDKKAYCDGHYFFYIRKKKSDGTWVPFNPKGYMDEDLWKDTENKKRVICHKYYNVEKNPNPPPKNISVLREVCVGFPDKKHPKQ